MNSFPEIGEGRQAWYDKTNPTDIRYTKPEIKKGMVAGTAIMAGFLLAIPVGTLIYEYNNYKKKREIYQFPDTPARV